MGEGEVESPVPPPVVNGVDSSVSNPHLTVTTTTSATTSDPTKDTDTTTNTLPTPTSTTGTTNTTTDSHNNNSNPTPAEIFAPGDHVIRWEMLPIAWPIQIHGIVLSVSDATVVLVDFGLTAAPQDTMETQSPTPTGTTPVTSPSSSSTRLDATGTGETTKTDEDTNGATTSNRKKPSIFSSDPKEMEAAGKEWMEKSAASSKKILKSFQKLHPQTNKKRLNVLVLEDPTEWKKWKKVNYETGFFGFGGKTTNHTGPNNSSDDGFGTNLDETPKDESNKWWNKMKFGRSAKTASSSNLSQHSDDTATESKTTEPSSAWFRRPVTSSTHLLHSESGASIASSTANNEATINGSNNKSNNKEMLSAKELWNKFTTSSSIQDSNGATSSHAVQSLSSASNGNVGDLQPKEPANATNVEEINKSPPQLEMEFDDEEEIGEKSKTQKAPQLELEPEESLDRASGSEQQQQQEKKSPTAFMNPAMARLMESKKEEQKQHESTRKGLFGKTSFFGKSKTKDTTETQNDGKAKKKLDLPKADPPKLVLARTRWLLEYGEAVLPPYHAFHSNSECIAVFCKTGYWSNLQADVFLHSTAIGNAKTMGAATIGVAASAPFLAPVIAGLGIGMVAAPWLILHSSKQQADDITLRMTDQFWAQAEPEVFVECIEHWSKLEEYYKRLETAQKQQDTPRIVTL